MATILTGWREQYERMHRSYAKFCVTSVGATSIPSAEARDDLIHFLQDAYHLKDWLKHDSASCSLTGTLEADITADDSLTMCADLCNGTKHLSNQPGRRNGPRAEFTGQGVNVHLPAIQLVDGQQVPSQPGHVSHNWVVAFEGTTVDAAALAKQVIAFWDSWLAQHGLL